MIEKWVKRAISVLARTLLRLRYRLDVQGLDEIVRKGRTGILFLPNHSALIDPVLMVALLYTRFAPRPLADEHQVTRTAFGKVALFFGSRTLPNLEREGAHARERMRAAVAGLVDDLRHGENVLLYPAGRLKRGYLEDVGSMSGTETIVKGLPDVRIVLVRHNGLWGSSFSLAFAGRMPDFGPAVLRGIKGVLASGLFFAPRRRVTIEFVEPDDFPRGGTRAEMNRYLEQFYNARASRNTYVPYSILGTWRDPRDARAGVPHVGRRRLRRRGGHDHARHGPPPGGNRPGRPGPRPPAEPGSRHGQPGGRRTGRLDRGGVRVLGRHARKPPYGRRRDRGGCRPRPVGGAGRHPPGSARLVSRPAEPDRRRVSHRVPRSTRCSSLRPPRIRVSPPWSIRPAACGRTATWSRPS